MILNCSIKKVYLDWIIQGAKKTEYRDMSDYWVKKICDIDAYPEKYKEDVNLLINDLQQGKVKLKVKPYDRIRFWSDKTVLTYEITDIKIYQSHKMFAIGLGKQIGGKGNEEK